MRYAGKQLHLGATLIVALVVLQQQQQHQIEASKSKCPASRQLEMDACAARMGFLGDHSFQVPRNASAMDAFCIKLKESISCIQSYSRDCLQGFTKQILNSLLKRGKQQHNTICQLDSSRQEFMQKMACLRDSEKIAQFHTCMDASIGRFEHIGSQLKPEIRLPGLCCSYQIFFADTSATLTRLCGSGAEANAFVQRFVTGTTGEFLQLICEGHRTMDDCRSSDKTKEALRQLEQVTKSVKAGKVKPKAKSLIPPLLEILDSTN